jgi:hypothetical protein
LFGLHGVYLLKTLEHHEEKSSFFGKERPDKSREEEAANNSFEEANGRTENPGQLYRRESREEV